MRFSTLRGRTADRIAMYAAMASLALGIGAATAIFTLVNSLLFRPIPVADPDRLFTLTTAEATADGYTDQYSYTTFEEIRRRDVVDDVLIWSTSLTTIDGVPQPVSSQWVSGNFFSMLGVRPVIGRAIGPADDVTGGGPDGPVAMISHRLWQQRFNGAMDVIGRSVRLERSVVTIVGVTPQDFTGVEVGRSFDLFIPGRLQPIVESGAPLDAHAPFLWLMVRLRPGQSVAAATAALRGVQPDVRKAALPPQWLPDTFLQHPFVLESAANGTSVYFGFRERYRGPLFSLLLLTALLLAAACANVANLFLAHGAARRGELTVRLVLGASRWRLIRRMVLESLLFAGAGTVVGLLFALWAARMLVTQLAAEAMLAPEAQPLVMPLHVDWRVLLFTSSVAAVAAAIFGVWPAVRATRVAPAEILNQDGRAHGHGGPARGLRAVLAVQVAVALVLIVTAGLFVRTFWSVTSVPLGFASDGLLLATVSAPTAPVEERNVLYHQLAEAITRVPGITSAGAAMGGPLTTFGGAGIPIRPSGARPLADEETITQIVNPTPGWMVAHGFRLIGGRFVDERDVAEALPVLVVNEAFVRRFYPGEQLLGRSISLVGNPGNVDLGTKTIVGIVAHTVYDSVRHPAPPAIYEPLAQRRFPLYFPAVYLAVRTDAGSRAQAGNRITTALRAVYPDLRVSVQPMAERVDAMLTQDRLLVTLSTFAAGLVILLAAIGLYGVTAYTVAARRRDLGIRLALGSQPSRLVRLVLGYAFRPIVIGIVSGSVASLWTGQLVASLLFGVTPRDPLVMIAAALTLVAVGLIAAWLPARRASLADPATVLRQS